MTWPLYLLIAAATFTADLLTKRLAASRLPTGVALERGRLPVRLRLVRNSWPGRSPRTVLVMWVMTATATVVLAASAVAVDVLAQAGLGAALGGATANTAEWLIRGSVVDFIDVRVWPVFNLADAGISAGIVLTLLGMI